LPKYIFKPVKHIVEQVYVEHTKTNIYDALGNVDFDKARIVVIADDIYEAEQIRKGVTDIRMWDLESED